MTPQEFKEQYRQLLQAYNAGEITWMVFETKLQALKRERDSDASSPGSGSFARASRISSKVVPPSESTSGVFRPRRIQPGDLLGGRYMLQRLLGLGQCGEAWRARENEGERYVVVKPLPLVIQHDKKAWQRFCAAFRHVPSLSHPNICPVYRMERDSVFGGFVVSAFLDAFSLDDYYERYCRTFGDFPIAAAVRVLWPVGKALDFAHRTKRLHRALMPQNILIGKQCGVMTTDFEIADAARAELQRLGISTDAVDPGPWHAPEVWLDDEHSPRSDQFSLAVIACQLITGTMPFRGKNSREIRDNIIHRDLALPESLPNRVASALKRALSKKPADRFPSCFHFLWELAGSETGGPHFDQARAPQEKSPGRFWPLLFGLPTPPAPDWLEKPSEAELWPFQNLGTTLDPKDISIPDSAAYPYAGTGSPVASAASGATFLPIALAIGSLAAAAVGGAIALNTETARSVPPENEVELRRADDATPENMPTAPAKSRPGETFDRKVRSNTAPSEAANSNVGSESTATIETEDLANWVHQAAEGDLEAQRRLGEAYFYGRGVKADYKKAADFLRLAANQGDVSALYHLGRCNELGLGLPKDVKQAVTLYREAKSKGSDAARKALDRLIEAGQATPGG